MASNGLLRKPWHAQSRELSQVDKKAPAAVVVAVAVAEENVIPTPLQNLAAGYSLSEEKRSDFDQK